MKTAMMILVLVLMLNICFAFTPTEPEMTRDLKFARGDKMYACGHIGAPNVNSVNIVEVKEENDIIMGIAQFNISMEILFSGNCVDEEEWTFRYINTQHGWAFDGLIERTKSTYQQRTAEEEKNEQIQEKNEIDELRTEGTVLICETGPYHMRYLIAGRIFESNFSSHTVVTGIPREVICLREWNNRAETWDNPTIIDLLNNGIFEYTSGCSYMYGDLNTLIRKGKCKRNYNPDENTIKNYLKAARAHNGVHNFLYGTMLDLGPCPELITPKELPAELEEEAGTPISPSQSMPKQEDNKVFYKDRSIGLGADYGIGRNGHTSLYLVGRIRPFANNFCVGFCFSPGLVFHNLDSNSLFRVRDDDIDLEIDCNNLENDVFELCLDFNLGYELFPYKKINPYLTAGYGIAGIGFYSQNEELDTTYFSINRILLTFGCDFFITSEFAFTPFITSAFFIDEPEIWIDGKPEKYSDWRGLVSVGLSITGRFKGTEVIPEKDKEIEYEDPAPVRIPKTKEVDVYVESEEKTDSVISTTPETDDEDTVPTINVVVEERGYSLPLEQEEEDIYLVRESEQREVKYMSQGLGLELGLVNGNHYGITYRSNYNLSNSGHLLAGTQWSLGFLSKNLPADKWLRSSGDEIRVYTGNGGTIYELNGSLFLGWNFLPSARINPYVTAGIGMVWYGQMGDADSSLLYLTIPSMAGIDINLNRDYALTLFGKYDYPLPDPTIYIETGSNPVSSYTVEDFSEWRGLFTVGFAFVRHFWRTPAITEKVDEIVYEYEEPAPIEMPETEEFNVTRELEEKGVFVIHDINFEFDSYEIPSSLYPLLEEVAMAIIQHPEWVIEIAGHTDSIGPESYNQLLSEMRMESVLEYLFANFENFNRTIYIAGYGESRPIGDNNTEEGRALNRRVEFKIVNRD